MPSFCHYKIKIFLCVCVSLYSCENYMYNINVIYNTYITHYMIYSLLYIITYKIYIYISTWWNRLIEHVIFISVCTHRCMYTYTLLCTFDVNTFQYFLFSPFLLSFGLLNDLCLFYIFILLCEVTHFSFFCCLCRYP